VTPVPPGSTIGIVGGGQLGRMLAIAAAQLGYRCHIYAPEEAPPAAEVAADFTRGAYDDEAALARFGASVAVATYEFENIAAAPLDALAAEAPLYPAPPRARNRAGSARRKAVRRRPGWTAGPLRPGRQPRGAERGAPPDRHPRHPQDPPLRL
jgi:5-(carboxyamino)imidazole ribonucleotide synthase